MSMSSVTMINGTEAYPELEGRRVLIAGLRSATGAGAEIVRAFAARGCRLVLQLDAPTPALHALAEEARGQALELRVFIGALGDEQTSGRLIRVAAQAFGGLDVAVNLCHLALPAAGAAASADEVDMAVARTLRSSCQVARIAADRMRHAGSAGLVVNVLVAPSDHDSRIATLLAGLCRSELEQLTRIEASGWGGDGIRFAALAPSNELAARPPALSGLPAQHEASSPASAALYLASDSGRWVNGVCLSIAGDRRPARNGRARPADPATCGSAGTLPAGAAAEPDR